MAKKKLGRLCPELSRHYMPLVAFAAVVAICSPDVYAAEDIWTKAHDLIVSVYNSIVGISTVLAALMSAIAVLGAKMSSNQHKVDQAWDWLKRIWVAWAIINGIGAFLAFIVPMFQGLNTLTPSIPASTPAPT